MCRQVPACRFGPRPYTHTHQLPPKQEGRQSESEKKMCETKRKYFNCYEFRRFSHWTFGIVHALSLSLPTHLQFSSGVRVPCAIVCMCSTSSLSCRCCYRQCRDKLMFYRYFILLRIHIVMWRMVQLRVYFYNILSPPTPELLLHRRSAIRNLWHIFHTPRQRQQPTHILKGADAAKVREGISNGNNCHRRLNLWFSLQRKVHWSKGTADWGVQTPAQL